MKSQHRLHIQYSFFFLHPMIYFGFCMFISFYDITVYHRDLSLTWLLLPEDWKKMASLLSLLLGCPPGRVRFRIRNSYGVGIMWVPGGIKQTEVMCCYQPQTYWEGWQLIHKDGESCSLDRKQETLSRTTKQLNGFKALTIRFDNCKQAYLMRVAWGTSKPCNHKEAFIPQWVTFHAIVMVLWTSAMLVLLGCLDYLTNVKP